MLRARIRGRCAALAAAAGVLAFAAPAGAHELSGAAAYPGESEAVTAADGTMGPCPGEAIAPDRVIEGRFPSTLQGSYVMLPFDVPAGQTAVRVKYCFDQPDSPLSAHYRHTLDLGLYQPRAAGGGGVWGPDEFRGWGGSSHPDVTVSPEGFSTEAQYEANPRGRIPGKTTRAFLPGPIPAGEWAVELGAASIIPKASGDSDGSVAWRVEIDWTDNPAFADEPYSPADYDETPARAGAAWYAGDFHVHGEHSALGDAPMREVFDYAFGPLSEGRAGLDFITLSDYVSGSAWGEIGRYQANYPGHLIVRSAEVITYDGHANNHASLRRVDYRTGRIFEQRPGGRRILLRGRRPASQIFDAIHAGGGFTQINHPTIFPSQVPLFDSMCRGCPWDYSPAQTDYSKVDAIEIATGPSGAKAPGEPGPNPFTPTAIQFYENALALGQKIAAVGSSDSHNAGRTPNAVTQSPIGEATTVVHAPELSEEGIRCGVQAGHTYVKVAGNDGPDLRFEGRKPGTTGPPAIMGDTIAGKRARFEARVLGGGPGSGPTAPVPYELVVFKDGVPFVSATVTSDDFTHRFEATGPGRYRLQLQRGTAIDAVSSPIYLEPGADPAPVCS